MQPGAPGRKRGTRGASGGHALLLRLTPDLAEEAESAAKAKGITLTEWIREAIRAALNR